MFSMAANARVACCGPDPEPAKGSFIEFGGATLNYAYSHLTYLQVTMDLLGAFQKSFRERFCFLASKVCFDTQHYRPLY